MAASSWAVVARMAASAGRQGRGVAVRRNLAEIVAITVALVLVGAWQYTRFAQYRYGLFYSISPTHGDWILIGSFALIYVGALRALLSNGGARR